MKNEKFGRLLKAMINSIATQEDKTNPIIEDELGQKIGVSPASVQRYKAGHIPPEIRTIEIFSDAAVKRGGYSREWLQNFLLSAHYPKLDKVLDQLCPVNSTRVRPERVYHNLPAPTYTKFVMREQVFADVLDGLGQRSAVVLIQGLGGNGKTSIAREVAAHCLKEDQNGPKFDAAIWVSDKDQPGTTTLSIVLDEVARTLDYPGFTQFEHEEKRREVEQLLRRQKVLLVVDNFETITDGALLYWLLRLPEPSKAIITSREYRREFRRGGWPIELRGMSEAEVQKLIQQRLQLLRMEKLVVEKSQLEPLIVATGGNPKAIEITLGLLKYERLTLPQVIDDLYKAHGELFDDLFTRAWSLLDEAMRRVLLATVFFAASTSGEALSATADVGGYAFDRAIERLIDLALLDTHQLDFSSPSRYLLHPLVRAFASSQLQQQPLFEVGARERWVNWYRYLLSDIGYSWDNLLKLEVLDIEQENLFVVFSWLSQQQHYEKLIQLTRNHGIFFYNIRGYWDKYLTIRAMCIEAALKLNNLSEEAIARATFAFFLCRQGRIMEAQEHFPRLIELEKSGQLEQEAQYELHYTFAFYWKLKGDLDSAQQEWRKALEAKGLSLHEYLLVQYKLAKLHYQRGELDQALTLLSKTLEEATKISDNRNIIFNQILLSKILIEQGELGSARQYLALAEKEALKYQDRENIANSQLLSSTLHKLEGDLMASYVTLKEAIDLFERLGMRPELAEARDELVRLEAKMEAESGGQGALSLPAEEPGLINYLDC